ncbi:protein RESTRICTED TEV MOVEMENT 3-like isoform X1 [Punica granatum]|uniref:Protein RESTRICTED TEV MOVEMENT 3-like isoform X1 n=1 Tax=Punica granatum TaxID=22663 RepID=A0A218XPF3_PUNGR|nr:protein RESTRICTED TEV MOVEMENT 3-like isoform X1 [Punica granatum]OWM86833.1 hypothetical protein CDL15_Pgr015869 [Punica granatum]
MEEEQQLRSGKYTWVIDSFSEKKNKPKFFSDAFTVGGCKWRIVIYPKGNGVGIPDHLSMFLEVADAATLPDGWCRDAKFAFTLVDQDSKVGSTTKSWRNKFTAESSRWGFMQFMRLTKLHDNTKGYVVHDAVVVEVEITLHEVVPLVELATQVNTLGTYFSRFSDYFTTTGTPHLEEGSASNRQTIDLASDAPSSDDIEKAKRSLKECLSDLFKLNMKDRLSSALSILSHARAGLSTDQKRSIKKFKANFDDFVCDFLNFEQDNSDFELQKITRDHIYSAMKRNHETHLSHQQLFDSITMEKEELNKRLKELSFRETKLVDDWETLMNESEEVKSRYAIQERMLAQAEEKKKIAEERMSRSTSAWSSLKEQFL